MLFLCHKSVFPFDCIFRSRLTIFKYAAGSACSFKGLRELLNAIRRSILQFNPPPRKAIA